MKRLLRSLMFISFFLVTIQGTQAAKITVKKDFR